MSGGIRWTGDLEQVLSRAYRRSERLDDDMAYGAEAVLEEAVALVPKESGALAASGRIHKNRGGVNTVVITFDGPYARWIHEHLQFKHPRGGQAKYLEAAMLLKGRDAMNRAGQHFWRRAT